MYPLRYKKNVEKGVVDRMMINTITDKSNFIKLVKNKTIPPSLKSYSDTLLFYYVGYLAAINNDGDFFEIGAGGSTFPLLELSHVCNRLVNLVDLRKDPLLEYANNSLVTNAKIKIYNINSQTLSNKVEIKNLAYSHIDGSKNFTHTVHDLQYCLSVMSNNGIICQDDYGNNKWPTVTDAVQSLIHSGELKMIIVGDSSAWVTHPKYYDYWINLLNQNTEFTMLSKLLNVVSSDYLDKFPEYFYMNANQNKITNSNLSVDEIDYFNQLLDSNDNIYLQMPYFTQSSPGVQLQKETRYIITKLWSILRGNDWPINPPILKEDIDNLPQWIKDEIMNTHNQDLYRPDPLGCARILKTNVQELNK
jgi:hypothetical protein